MQKSFSMFILDFLVPLGLILLEKVIIRYSKAVKAVSRPSIGEIQNLQFATVNFCFLRLKKSTMMYKITPAMILRRIFINNNFKSKMELGELKNEKILEKTIEKLILRILIAL